MKKINFKDKLVITVLFLVFIASMANAGNIYFKNGDLNMSTNPIIWNDDSGYWLVVPNPSIDWGIYWGSASKTIQFRGSGSNLAQIDLDDGDIKTEGTIGAKGTTPSGTYGFSIDDSDPPSWGIKVYGTTRGVGGFAGPTSGYLGYYTGGKEYGLYTPNNASIGGNLEIEGTCTSQGADCAEDIAELWHSVASYENTDCETINNTVECTLDPGFELEFETGDVVCIDTGNTGRIDFCSGAYDTTVLSVINYDATTILGQRAPYPLSIGGEVPVKVVCDTEIERGDLLVTASTDGYAQSVDAVMPESWQQVWNKLGSPFAKALEPCSEGTNIIRAWII